MIEVLVVGDFDLEVTDATEAGSRGIRAFGELS
jgi:hypothetical protein